MLTDTEKYLVVKEAIKRGGAVATIAENLGDDFFRKYTKTVTKYNLALSAKETYKALYGEDKYSDFVESATVSINHEGFVQVIFTIKFVDKVHWVFGTLNRTFSVHKNNVAKYSEIIKVEKTVTVLL